MGRLLLVGAVSVAACGGVDEGGLPFTPQPATYGGAVSVHIAPPMPGATTLAFEAYAYFLDYTGKTHVPNGADREGRRATDCRKHEVDSCTLITCTIVKDASITFDTPTYSAAGTITVTRSSGPSLMMSPSAPDAFYNGRVDNTPAPTAGETVAIAAAGGAVPTFAETVTITSPLTQVTPAPAAEVQAPASQDLALAWTGGASDKVSVGFQNMPDEGDMAALYCTFDTTAGHGAIPSALLKLLPAWDPGWIVGFTDVPKVRTVDKWPVSVSAIYQAKLNQPMGFTLVVNP